MRPVVPVLALCGALIGSAGLATGRPGRPPAALTRELEAGVDAFRLGKLDEARKHLEKARAIDPKLPGPHRFLAAVASAKHEWQACIDAARSALMLDPHAADSVEAGQTRKLHDDCRSSAGRPAYRGELADGAAISVTSSVQGATVKIRGLIYGSTPLEPRPIVAGSLDIEIAKPGWKSIHTKVDAPTGIVTDVVAELLRE